MGGKGGVGIEIWEGQCDTGIDKTERYGRGSDQSSKQNKDEYNTLSSRVSGTSVVKDEEYIDRWPMVMEIKSKTETKRKRDKKTP